MKRRIRKNGKTFRKKFKPGCGKELKAHMVSHAPPTSGAPAGWWVDGQTDRLAEQINSERGPQDRLPRWEKPQPDHWLIVRLLIESQIVLSWGISDGQQNGVINARTPVLVVHESYLTGGILSGNIAELLTETTDRLTMTEWPSDR
jgi:hypothetical protein